MDVFEIMSEIGYDPIVPDSMHHSKAAIQKFKFKCENMAVMGKFINLVSFENTIYGYYFLFFNINLIRTEIFGSYIDVFYIRISEKNNPITL